MVNTVQMSNYGGGVTLAIPHAHWCKPELLPLPTQLAANTDNGPSVWAIATHAGDPKEIHSSCLHAGPATAAEAISRGNQWMEELSVFPSLQLCFSNKFFKKAVTAHYHIPNT